MVVIGLTGNMGSGKSTVANMLTDLGAAHIDADKVGHELLKRGGDAYNAVVAAFGDTMLTAAGEIDRYRLGQHVFADVGLRKKLNGIMHPRIREEVSKRIEICRQKGVKAVFLEAALLNEAGWLPLVDQVWVTVVPAATAVDRVIKSRGMTGDDAAARLRSQQPPEEKAKGADVVIDTDCTFAELKEKVTRLWESMVI